MTAASEAQEGEGVNFREARRADLDVVVRLLAADSLVAGRESIGDGSLPEVYVRAFEEIDADPRNRILVGEFEGRVVACLQLTFIPGLTYQGRGRAQIEGVRVDASMRGQGIGKALVRHAIALGWERGCALIQLTTDKRRAEAHRFYEGLGFVPSHTGMKLPL